MFVLAAARLRTAAAVVMQAVKLKLKALPRHSQAAISRLSTDVRAKVAAKKQERAASKEAKNASAGGAASSPAAAESAGSAGQGMQKIRALSQAARRSASKLSASFSKKDRCPRRRVRLLHTSCFTPPWRRVGRDWGQGRVACARVSTPHELPVCVQPLAVAQRPAAPPPCPPAAAQGG